MSNVKKLKRATSIRGSGKHATVVVGGPPKTSINRDANNVLYVYIIALKSCLREQIFFVKSLVTNKCY